MRFTPPRPVIVHNHGVVSGGPIGPPGPKRSLGFIKFLHRLSLTRLQTTRVLKSRHLYRSSPRHLRVDKTHLGPSALGVIFTAHCIYYVKWKNKTEIYL